MKISAVKSENYLFLNLLDEDNEIIIETPVFKKEDVKKVLQSYSLFVKSTVILENISQDEKDSDSLDELLLALDLDVNIDE